tara:strand:- start:136 stop:528 length:393 start_codon:yes stop_codon:yes gene_type:complete
MKLKKLLESTPGFENRKFGDKLPTLASVQKAFRSKQGIKEDDEANTTGEFDYDYYIEQLAAVSETIEEFEYELLQTLDTLAEDDQVYGLVSDKAEQASNQIRRYINGAVKQLGGIQDLLERHKRSGDLDQ